MKLYIILSLVMMSLLQSCKGQNMDDVINRLDKIDFSDLQGKSIYFRSKGNSPNTSIYFVNVFSGKCSPYVVEVDKTKIDGLIIKNDLVLKTCKEDYLSKETIKKAITKYLELDVCLVQVDNFGNIYINPSKQEAPILLKKSDNPPKDINQFEPFKNEWYIKK